MNWGGFKDSLCYLCLAGAVVSLWSLTEEATSLNNPLNYKYYITNALNSMKTFGKTAIENVNVDWNPVWIYLKCKLTFDWFYQGVKTVGGRVWKPLVVPPYWCSLHHCDALLHDAVLPRVNTWIINTCSSSIGYRQTSKVKVFCATRFTRCDYNQINLPAMGLILLD